MGKFSVSKVIDGRTYSVIADDQVELLNWLYQLDKALYIIDVFKSLLTAKCPTCEKELVLRKGDKFWLFMAHKNASDEEVCKGHADYNGDLRKNWSLEQLDKELNKADWVCDDCKKEWKEVGLVYRRDGGICPYTQSSLKDKHIKEIYWLSLEDVAESYLKNKSYDIWGCAKYKDTWHKYKKYKKN